MICSSSLSFDTMNVFWLGPQLVILVSSPSMFSSKAIIIIWLLSERRIEGCLDPERFAVYISIHYISVSSSFFFSCYAFVTQNPKLAADTTEKDRRTSSKRTTTIFLPSPQEDCWVVPQLNQVPTVSEEDLLDNDEAFVWYCDADCLGGSIRK